MRYQIFGAGLFGLTIGRLLHDAGHQVIIYEKENYIGGMLHTRRTPDGVEIHEHGAHIFHTDYEEVYEFINKYGEWNNYIHKVKAQINVMDESRLVSLPLSYATLSDFYGITNEDDIKWMLSSTSRMRHPNPHIEELISRIGWDLYNYVIKPYSENQWGCNIEDIPNGVIDRIGFKPNWNTNYFNDKYQLLPKNGYDDFLWNLSKDLTIITGYHGEVKTSPDCITIYTGPLDELVSDIELEYRTVRFDHQVTNFDEVDLPVINTPGAPHTRYITHNLFNEYSDEVFCYRSYEYPMNWTKDCKLPRYYPVNNDVNEINYNIIKQQVSLMYTNLIPAGRLGEYKYYDMDDTIYNAIKLFNKLCKSVSTK